MRSESILAVALFSFSVCQAGEIAVSPDGITPQAAVEKIRAAKAAGDKSAWTVRVAPGLYAFDKPLVFTPADSGTPSAPVRWIADRGEAVFSGGGLITGWKDAGNGVWEAPVPRDADGKPIWFQSLYANGRRAQRARHPDSGFVSLTSWKQVAVTNASQVAYNHDFVFKDPAFDALNGLSAKELAAAELQIRCKWSYGAYAIGGWDTATRTVKTSGHDCFERWKIPSERGVLYALENVRAGFDSPGEWFYDVVESKIKYRPLPGECLADFKALAPLSQLVSVLKFKGDPEHGKYVTDMSFEGIAVTCSRTDGDRLATGFVQQYNFQAAKSSGGCVFAKGAQRIAFEKCRVFGIENYAMWFDIGCVSNRIHDCTLEDLGAGGIWIGSRQSNLFNARHGIKEPRTEFTRVIPYGDPKVAKFHQCAFFTIDNCTIRHAGQVNPEGCGIALTHVSDSSITHCDIYDLYYTGISVGWTWGYTGSLAQRNTIAFNRIWDLGKHVMADMGGVYTLATSFGTCISNNIIHHVDSVSYGGWGLYNDEGSEGIVWENNLVYDTKDSSYHQHYGKDNVVRNNILACSKEAQFAITRAEPHLSVAVTNNIIYWETKTPAFKSMNIINGKAKVDWKDNIFWCAVDPTVINGPVPAIVCDPKFVDPAKRDFRLQSDSPVTRYGFKPWDFSLSGRTAQTLGAHAESPWRLTPIYGGGSVQDVVICPSNPNVWYTFVDVCGPFRSDNAGADWRDLHRNMTPSMCRRRFNHVRGFSVDPRDPNRFVIAGGDNGWRPGGLAISRDGGKTFVPKARMRFHGNGKSRRLGRVLDRDPFDPDCLIAGEDWDGVFVSKDNGDSWTASGLDRTYLCDLRYDRTVKGRIYAASPAKVWGLDVVFGHEPKVKPTSGLFRSDDGGANWRKVCEDSPEEILQIPGDRTILGIFGERFIRRSDDGCETWRDFGEGLPILDHEPDKSLQRGRFIAMACGGKGRFWVVGDSAGNFFRRGISDKVWMEIKIESYTHPDAVREPWFARSRKRHAEMPGSLVIDTRDENHWLLTDWYNIMESHDGGRNWRSRNSGMQQLCPFVVSCDPHSSENIIYGLADMGVFCSTNGGRTYFSPHCSGGVNGVAWSSATKGLVLVTGGKSRIDIRRSLDGGVTWRTPKLKGLPPLAPNGHGAFTIAENPKTGEFYLAVSGDENASGQGGVYASADAGDSWTWCGQGLPKKFRNAFRGGEFEGSNPQIVFSPDGSAVVILKDGAVYYREPQGKEWKPSNLTMRNKDWSTLDHPVAQIVADPHTPGRFLSTTANGYFHIGESVDGGKTFNRTWMQTGIVGAISFDRHAPGVIYASKFDGIYFSRDNGRHWSYLEDSLALPCGASRRIYADRNRLYFLTDGTGVWVRDVKK